MAVSSLLEPTPLVAGPSEARDFAIRSGGLRRSYGRVEAVRGVDLEIPRGEIFGIVGPDGAGKTTLIQMLCGILDPGGGSASVLGLDTVRDASRLAERIGYMSQVFSLYGNLSVAENIEFFADLHFIAPERRRARAERLLRFSRLASFTGRLARQLSGGMQKKLALCTMLVHDPEILFLDEPTTGVDPVSRRDFWEIVFDFLHEGVTVFVATPYLDEAERCQRVALMHEGRLLAVDTPERLKSRLGGRMAEVRTPEQARALVALRSDPAVREAQVFGRSIHALLDDMSAYHGVEARLRALEIPVETVRWIEPTLEDVFVSLLDYPAASDGAARIDQGNAAHRDATRVVGTGPVARDQERGGWTVEVDGLSRRFGDFVAVDRLSFSVREGEVFGFLGPNGSGKSTTIRMLTGVLAPSGGTARMAGFDIVRQAGSVRPLLGYMSQRFSLYDDLTADENLDFFAGLYEVPRSGLRARKREVLELVGLVGLEAIPAGSLSGGWKQRLALAAAVLHQPRILLLDEPTSGVDPLSRRHFWDLIFRMAAQGVTVLVTTHYMDEAERCDRVALIAQGRLLALGSPAQLRDEVDGRMLEVVVRSPFDALRAARELPCVRQVSLHGARLHLLLDPDADAALLRAHLEGAGHAIQEIAPVPLSLEDVFTALVESATAERSPVP